MTKSGYAIVVNAMRSRAVSWLAKFYDPVQQTLNAMLSVDISNPYYKMLVEKLRDAVIKLPVKVHTPKPCSALSIPRYFLIVGEVTNETDETYIIPSEVRIHEIVGIKVDLTPTKWSYRMGYWHPVCQFKIVSALSALLSTQPNQ